ncbi:hypothetical protein GCM10027168_60480 [Streptomyces capparidis]
MAEEAKADEQRRAPGGPGQALPAETGLPGEADFPMEIDEAALEERAEPVSFDTRTRLLARENRFGLRAGPAVRHELGTSPGTAVDLPLRCVAHRHPECRLRWVSLLVDLSGCDGTVLDLSPRDEVAAHPVRVTTTFGGGLAFQIAAVPVGPEATAERSTRQDVFYPKVTSSGQGFSAARWDFTQVGQEPLHVDRELRLLVGVPAGTGETRLHAVLRAGLSVQGALGVLPLVGRRRVHLDAEGTWRT